MRTDRERLDWLEAQNAKAKYTGRCMFRWSVSGRGWRLHETSGGPEDGETFTSVRDAIDAAMASIDPRTESKREGQEL